MSPILTRPVREQLEHDRVVRLLQARYKRKTDVIINPGNEQNQSITVGDLVVYPDVLIFAEGTRKLLGTIEVETGESVNSLEARAEWAVFCKLKVPLHLYVPPTSVDAARRLCAEYAIPVAELWTFHTTFDQIRFTMIYRSPNAPVVKVGASLRQDSHLRRGSGGQAGGQAQNPAPKTKVAEAPKPAAKPAAKAKLVAKAKPVTKAKPVKPKAKVKPKPKARPAPKKAKAAKKAPLRQGSHLRRGSGGQAGGQAKPAKKRR